MAQPPDFVVSDFFVSVVMLPELVVGLDVLLLGGAVAVVVSVFVVSVWLDAVLLGCVASVLFVVVSVWLVALLLVAGGGTFSVVLLTVVLDDDVEAGRSQPASVIPAASAAMASHSADVR